MSGSSSDSGSPPEPVQEPTAVGRYLIFDEIGVGGMASVHLGLLSGAVGFRRIVAVKQLHSRFVGDPDFVAQFINEARLAARIHHTNVVQTLDVVWTGSELLLVMEYVDGDTLNRVLKSATERAIQVPIDVACSMLAGVLYGLHAAHEVRDEDGAPLNIVHRDVSPQNILIARDGVARVLDFGVAKAAAQGYQTESGLLKGKFGYMAPEQIMRSEVDRRTDVFAAGVVLWETLTRRRLFQTGKSVEKALARLLSENVSPPSSFRPEVPKQLDAIVMKAIDRDPAARFQTAEAFAVAVEGAVVGASHHLVKTWFEPIASQELAQRARLVQSINKRHGAPVKVLTPNPGQLNFSLPLLPLGIQRIGPDEETRRVKAVSASSARLPARESPRSALEPPLQRPPDSHTETDLITPQRPVSWPPEVPAAPVRSETPFGHVSSSSSMSAGGVESRAPGADTRRPQRVAVAILLVAIVAAVLIIVLGRRDAEAPLAAAVAPPSTSSSGLPVAAPPSEASHAAAPDAPTVAAPPRVVDAGVQVTTLPEVEPVPSRRSGRGPAGPKATPRNAKSKAPRGKDRVQKPGSDLGLRLNR